MRKFLAAAVVTLGALAAASLALLPTTFAQPRIGGPFGNPQTSGVPITGGTITSGPLVLNTDVQLQMGTSANSILYWNSAQTADTLTLGVGALSNNFLIAEKADLGFDFAHALATDPTLFVHSHNQSTTQWVSLTHDGTNAVLDAGAGVVNIPDGLTTAGNLVTTGSGTLTVAGLSTVAAVTASGTLQSNGKTNIDGQGDGYSYDGGTTTCKRVVLGSPQADSGGACTFADVTGLSFSALISTTYKIHAELWWTSAAGTTGAAFSLNGPTNSFLTIQLIGSAGSGSGTIQNVVAYDTTTCPAAAQTAGNRSTIDAKLTTTAAGTVIVRMASEIDTSAVTVLAGSWLEYCDGN